MSELMPTPALIGLYSPAPGCGKTTAARALGPWGYNKISFADPLREMLVPILRHLGVDPFMQFTSGMKEAPLPDIGKSTRDLLRTLGTEWGRRQVHSDLWLILASNRIYELHTGGLGVVIDDVRFPNEAQFVKNMGGILVRIDRPGVDPPSTHASDTSLNDYDEWDYVLTNDAETADGFCNQVIDFIESLEVDA